MAAEPIDRPIDFWRSETENTFRGIKAREYLREAASLGLLPVTDVEKAQQIFDGQASVVFKILSLERSYIVKMTPDQQRVIREAGFLKQWEKIGIKVPELVSLHITNEALSTSFLVEKFIEAPKLSQATTPEERVKLGISRQIGRILAKMHKVKGTGYGIPMADDITQGSSDDFVIDIKTRMVDKIFAKLTECEAVQEKGENVIAYPKMAITELENDFKQGRLPCLTHNDLTPENIFYTSPDLTIIDPNAIISHPYLDLANTLYYCSTEEKAEVLLGYQQESREEINDKVLNAARVIVAIVRLNSAAKRKDDKRIKKGLSKLEEAERDFNERS